MSAVSARLALLVALSGGAACTPGIAITGSPCTSDADCVGRSDEAAHFCQVDVEPHVCLFGDGPGVPPRVNRAPSLETAFAVVVVGDQDGVAGQLGTFDPDGDPVRVLADATIPIPLTIGDIQYGTLRVDSDGSYFATADLALDTPIQV